MWQPEWAASLGENGNMNMYMYMCGSVPVPLLFTWKLLIVSAITYTWQPTPVFLPGKSHGQRSLLGYSLWGCKESDTTEQLHFHYTAIQNKHFFLLICFLSHKFFLLQTIYDFHCPVPGKSLFQTGFSQTTQSFHLTPWTSPAFKHSVC